MLRNGCYSCRDVLPIIPKRNENLVASSQAKGSVPEERSREKSASTPFLEKIEERLTLQLM